jgi:hypothetical protein
MDRIPEKAITGAYAGKREDCTLRDKMNEIIDWVNEFEAVDVMIPEPDEALIPAEAIEVTAELSGIEVENSDGSKEIVELDMKDC